MPNDYLFDSSVRSVRAAQLRAEECLTVDELAALERLCSPVLLARFDGLVRKALDKRMAELMGGEQT